MHVRIFADVKPQKTREDSLGCVVGWVMAPEDAPILTPQPRHRRGNLQMGWSEGPWGGGAPRGAVGRPEGREGQAGGWNHRGVEGAPGGSDDGWLCSEERGGRRRLEEVTPLEPRTSSALRTRLRASGLQSWEADGGPCSLQPPCPPSPAPTMPWGRLRAAGEGQARGR